MKVVSLSPYNPSNEAWAILKKEEERWHAKEAWPTVSEREKISCKRSMTQKNGHKNVQEKRKK